MRILKFGGSSVGTPERINKVIDIVINYSSKYQQIAVVFSAFQGVTDQLIAMSRLAEEGSKNYLISFDELKDKFSHSVFELLSPDKYKFVSDQVNYQITELYDVLKGVMLVRELSPRTLDYILSFGERISAFIICEAIKDRGVEAEFLDARKVIITDDSFGFARVKFDETFNNIQRYFSGHNRLQMVTGFIASTQKNETTTLGRGGSDYTASIIGAALCAEEIEIWTDVNGVMTADPRKVKKAFSLKTMTYQEAMELSHFGAKVIHPPTIQPALENKIPLRIKNTFSPDFEGTVIHLKNGDNKFSIRGISSIDNISLLRIEGSGLASVSGIARRIFNVLSGKNINILLMTQASSEYSLCMALTPSDALVARELVEEELKLEIIDKLISSIVIEDDLSIIAVIGENMRSTPGITWKIFEALGKNGVSVAAIAQGSSQLNISAVIAKEDVAKALNALHDIFFLSYSTAINLFLVGTGLIGRTLLEQIKKQREYLEKEYFFEIKVIGIANSRKMYFEKEGIDLDKWNEQIKYRGSDMNLEKFISEMKQLNLQNSIFIDCTASQDVTDKYLEIINSTISIVTPNKKANSGSYEYYSSLRQSAVRNNVKFLYETNVGAGLPVINTLSDLINSGDRVIKIEGILSGTLSYIFNCFDGTIPFSQIIKAAKEKGFTEPDPREDLNGADVARKLLILSRAAGYKLEFEDIKIENLVPEELRNTSSIEEFLDKLSEYDEYYKTKYITAAKQNKTLRYIACFDGSKAEIALREVDKDHPFYSLSGSDNIISLTTKRYKDYPMVIKGPGAGAEVTAAGVFADIVKIAYYLT